MGNPSRTSFIPKSPKHTTVRPRGVQRVFVLTYVSSIFFFGTLVALVGVFVWNLTINKQLEVQKNAFIQQRDTFDQAGIESVRELSTRLSTATDLLNEQVSVLSLFTALETTTLKPIQVTDFEYKNSNESTSTVSFLMNTQDFSESLFQNEVFTGNSILEGATVSEITFENPESAEESESSVSGVTFRVTKTLTVSDIPYTVSTPIIATTTSINADISSLQNSGTSSIQTVTNTN